MAATVQHVLSVAARRRKWARAHPGDVIRRVDKPRDPRFGEWWECVRGDKQLAEANDPGMLMDELERAFR